jgi:uncharacterized protein (TIGR02466 family)
MKKFELFPTPVAEFDFTNHPDIPILLNYINSLQVPNHPLVENGVSSHSKSNVLFHSNLINLRNDFQKCVDYYSKDLKIVDSYISFSWFNKMDNKGKTLIHHHGASVISSAFYPLLEENTCNLVFKSPLYTAINFIPTTPNPTNHYQPDFIMPIKQNHLYLFPGWLEHYTEENRGGKRVVVSFNTKFY